MPSSNVTVSDVVPDELDGLFRQAGFEHGAIRAFQADDRPAQLPPFPGVVILLRPEPGHRIDPRLGQEPVGIGADEHQSGDGRRLRIMLVEKLGVDEKPCPFVFPSLMPLSFPVFGECFPVALVLALRPCLCFAIPVFGWRGCGRFLLSDLLEVVPEPAAVQIPDRGTGHRTELQPEGAPLLKQAFQLFRACLPAGAADSDVPSAMLVVPYVVDPPAAIDPDHGDVAAWLHVADDLELGNELRADFVAAGLHHPLFELLV